MRIPHDIIIKPIITEESMNDMAYKKYTFKVDKRANKSEIKKAVEKIFDVKVEKVNTMNMLGKEKRMGVHVGRRPRSHNQADQPNSPQLQKKSTVHPVSDRLHYILMDKTVVKRLIKEG